VKKPWLWKLPPLTSGYGDTPELLMGS